MGRVKTSDEIIDGVKLRAMLPEDSAAFSSSDYLSIIDEEFGMSLLPAIMKVHEEYYVSIQDVPIVAGQKNYKIPHRAIGAKVRDMNLRDSNDKRIRLTRIQPEDVSEYRYQPSYAFYLQNDEAVLLTEPSGVSSVAMSVYLRPNKLVENSRGGVITDITSGVITIGAGIPTHFGDKLDAGLTELFDFVSQRSPCKIQGFDISASAVDSTLNTVTFDEADLPSDLVVGDYITWEEETIVPQMPIELIPLLEQQAAIFCLESLGDAEGLALAEKRLAKMEVNINTLIDNRSEGTPQKVINHNSLMRKKFRRRKDVF